MQTSSRKSISAVQIALERDRQKDALRGAVAYQSSDDSDNDDDQPVRRKARHLKSIVKRMGNVNMLMAVRGTVQDKHVIKRSKARFDKPRTTSHNDFLGRVLSDVGLMAKTSECLHIVHKSLANLEEAQSAAVLLNGSSEVVHKMKVCTVHTCWDNHIEPLMEEKSQITIKYNSLKAQYSQARTAYLQEVAMLRDEVRVRGDPETGMPSTDIVHYLEPADMLLAGEQKFLLAALREKLKMVMERNPTVEKVVDLGQLERLAARVENHEMQEMRHALLRAKNKVKSMEEERRENMPPEAAHTSSNAGNARSEARMMLMLETQVAELQSKLTTERNDIRMLKRDTAGLQGDVDDLARGFQDASTELLVRQNELERLNTELKTLVVAHQQSEKQVETTSALLASRNTDLKALKKRLAQREVREERARKKDGPPADAHAPNTAQVDVFRQQSMGELSDVEFSKALRERDDALQRCRELEEKNEKLFETLQKHMKRLCSMKEEDMLDESHDAADEAELLGCVGLAALGCDARVCECGSLMMHDAVFCRKCGSRWVPPEGKVSQEREVVEALAVRQHDVEEQVQRANAELKIALEAEHAVGGAKRNEAWVEKAMTAQNELATLQNKKALIEAKMLKARVDEARARTMDNFAHSLDEAPCLCSCAEELIAVRALLERTQGLCTESTHKLKRAAMDNFSLSKNLRQVQGSLAIAVKTLEEAQRSGERTADDNDGSGTGGNCTVVESGSLADVATTAVSDGGVSSCIKAINNARQQTVFGRLHGGVESAALRDRREAKRNRLLRDTFQAVYPGVEDETACVEDEEEAPAPLAEPVVPRRPLAIRADSIEEDGPFLIVSGVGNTPATSSRAPPSRGSASSNLRTPRGAPPASRSDPRSNGRRASPGVVPARAIVHLSLSGQQLSEPGPGLEIAPTSLPKLK